MEMNIEVRVRGRFAQRANKEQALRRGSVDPSIPFLSHPLKLMNEAFTKPSLNSESISINS